MLGRRALDVPRFSVTRQASSPSLWGMLLYSPTTSMVKSRVLGGREGKSSHAEPPERPEPSHTKHIIDLAKLVLELNTFQFEDGFYLQVHGTAMGTRMAPSYANIFMGVFEESMLATAPNGRLTLLFHRFIDDVFGVWIYGEEALMEFFAHANQCHPDIVFTHSHGKSVAYLDVQASIQEDRIVTDLYEKPTNTHQYLLPSSNHPPHVHRNLPYGLGIRFRTIVSAVSKRRWKSI